MVRSYMGDVGCAGCSPERKFSSVLQGCRFLRFASDAGKALYRAPVSCRAAASCDLPQTPARLCFISPI